MIKRKKIGMIVWGSILFVIGTVFMLGCIINATSRYGYRGNDNIVFLSLGILFYVGAALLLAFGIRNVVLVSKNNRRVEEENRGILYQTNCFTCGAPVQVDIYAFQPHGRFPEGFVYCPYCKRPLSKNVFQALQVAPNAGDPNIVTPYQ